jgi:prepilin-type processing-associated H-X9-DG protein
MKRFALIYVTIAFAASFLTFSATPARAQAADQAYARIKPFIDDQTFLVVHADFSSVDFNTIRDWLNDQINHFKDLDAKNNEGKLRQDYEQMQNGLAMGTMAATRWLDNVKASGGRHAFMLVSVQNIRSERPPVFVFPIEGNADAKALGDAIFPFGRNQQGQRPRGMPVTEQVGDAVVFGDPQAVELFRDIKPVDRADLREAFMSSGDAPVRAAFVGSDDFANAVAQKAPKMPRELGGDDTAAVMSSAKWAAASVQLPPKVSANLDIQAVNAESAERLERIRADVVQVPARKMRSETWGDPAKLQTPKRQGDRLTLSLTSEQIIDQVGPVVSVAMVQARQSAIRVQSASNLRQLAMTVMLGYQATKQYPADIDAIIAQGNVNRQVLRNPLRPEKEIGYVYVKPAAQAGQAAGKPAEHVIFYEEHEKFGEGVNVGFLDGHVEYINNEERFKTLLEATKKRNGELEEGL